MRKFAAICFASFVAMALLAGPVKSAQQDFDSWIHGVAANKHASINLVGQ